MNQKILGTSALHGKNLCNYLCIVKLTNITDLYSAKKNLMTMVILFKKTNLFFIQLTLGC